MKCTNCNTETNLKELQRNKSEIDYLTYLTCPQCKNNLFESQHVDHKFRIQVV